MKYSTYAIIRLFMGIPTMLMLLLMVFYIMRILPGDPVIVMMGTDLPPLELDRIRHELGLDVPIYTQFITYLKGVMTLDLDTSFVTHETVIQELYDAYPVTLELTIGGLLVGIALGISLGLIAAWKKDSIIDQVIRVLSFGYYSMPGFWMALLLQMYIAAYLGLLPIAGRLPLTVDIHRITGLYTVDSILQLNFNAFVESIRYMILPWSVLGLGIFPRLSRVIRANMIDQMREDYVTFAMAKGLTEKIIIYRHILPNALLPTVTMIGMSFAGLLGGTVITETIFSLPGIGRLFISSIFNRDFNMIQGIVLVYGGIVVIVNTLVDLLYGLLDPRVRY